MDNIQKLILGVLGIAGMIAMLVPSDAIIAPQPAAIAPPPAAAEIVEPAATEEAMSQEEIDEDAAEESELSDEDVFMLGEPAIDGNPLQGSQPNNDAPPPAAAQFLPGPPIDYAQQGVVNGQQGVVTGQSFATPLTPAPPPAQ